MRAIGCGDRAHNQYEADAWFGAWSMPRAREEPAVYTA